MNVGLVYRDLLPPQVAQELESLTARIRTGWNVEHDAEGHHEHVTALSVASSGLIASGSDPLQGTQSSFSRKARFVHLSNASSGAEACGSAIIQQLIATVGSAQGFGSHARTAHGTGTVALLIGATGQVSVMGSGSATAIRGVNGIVYTEQGAGGATDAMAVRADVIGRVSGTGTITNGYGLYISHGSTGITNRWGVYQATASVPNFFAGKVLTVTPAATFPSDNSVGFEVPDVVLGAGAVPGPSIFIGFNASGSFATGTLGIRSRGTGISFIWPDASGNWRTHSARPTENNTAVSDTAGTVIGTQTSARAFKKHVRRNRRYPDMLRAVVETPLYDFQLKSGAFPDAHFTGLVTDESPLFGMDADTKCPGGKSLNTATCIGYLFGAIKALHARVKALES